MLDLLTLHQIYLDFFFRDIYICITDLLYKCNIITYFVQFVYNKFVQYVCFIDQILSLNVKGFFFIF